MRCKGKVIIINCRWKSAPCDQEKHTYKLSKKKLPTTTGGPNVDGRFFQDWPHLTDGSTLTIPGRPTKLLLQCAERSLNWNWPDTRYLKFIFIIEKRNMLRNVAVFRAPRPTLSFCADPTTFFFNLTKKFYKKGNFCATCCKKQIENPSITARVIVV